MKLIVETSRDTPLVWYQVFARGGAAADPEGREGFVRHAAELARRGAGDRSRAEIDQALDQLGASLNVSATRDRIAFTGVCLARNLEATTAIAADILARPRFAADEHAKLVAETRAILDEVRDDDWALAQRFFVREFGGPPRYARTALGTVESLERFDVGAARDAFRRMVVPANLVIGFAGDIDESAARTLAARLVADLPDDPTPELPDVGEVPAPRPRRALLVDKPERTQVQLMIGHTAPRFGTDDFEALGVVETIFGGTFTSRLMQELRVKHGWTYSASCRSGKARGPLWFRIDFASAADVAADALARALEMFADIAAESITEHELAFAKSYLSGSWPFHIATAHSRLRVRAQATLLGLPDDYAMAWPERLDKITLEQTRAAARQWLHPDNALTVAVATADEMLERLSALPIGDVQVVAHDSY